MNNFYINLNTINKSFIETYNFLKEKNIDVSYILGVYDKDLLKIDPYDENLTTVQKNKILTESAKNIWYYLREIVRVPQVGSDKYNRIKLNLGNLSIAFCMINNLDTITEVPSSTHNRMIEFILSWEFLFNINQNNCIMDMYKTTRIDFIKRFAYSNLPEYFKDHIICSEININQSIYYYTNLKNNNIIDNIISPKKYKGIEQSINSLKGKDRKIFFCPNYIKFSDKILDKIILENNIDRERSRHLGKSYGITILGIPSSIKQKEGKYLYDLQQKSSIFNLSWLELSKDRLFELVKRNNKTSFVYIKYSYEDLGLDFKWFYERSRMYVLGWRTIKKEILLEWEGTKNPFLYEDLLVLDHLSIKPKNILYKNGYEINIYDNQKDIELYISYVENNLCIIGINKQREIILDFYSKYANEDNIDEIINYISSDFNIENIYQYIKPGTEITDTKSNDIIYKEFENKFNIHLYQEIRNHTLKMTKTISDQFKKYDRENTFNNLIELYLNIIM